MAVYNMYLQEYQLDLTPLDVSEYTSVFDEGFPVSEGEMLSFLSTTYTRAEPDMK